MFTSLLKRIAPIACAAALLASPTAQADVLTFNIHWQGFGANNPYADAVVTLDTAMIGPFGVELPSPLVTAFNLSIHNTSTADGDYTLANFTNVVFDVPALDYSHQLCGQSVGFDMVMCDSRGPGQFYMYTTMDMPFSGMGNISIVSANPDDEMYISSMIATSAVPEPASYAMLALGLGLVGAAMRKRRRQG